MDDDDDRNERQRERERNSVIRVGVVYDIALHFGDGAEIRPRIERQPPRTRARIQDALPNKAPGLVSVVYPCLPHAPTNRGPLAFTMALAT